MEQPQAHQNRELFWHYPHYSNQGGKPGSAIRVGNHKLIYNYEDETVQLYDLVNGMAEKKDIASHNKPTAQQLRKKLFKWLKKTHAPVPYKNILYDPVAPSAVMKETRAIS